MKPSVIHKTFLIFTWTNKSHKTKVFSSTQGQTRNIMNRDAESLNKTPIINPKLSLRMLFKHIRKPHIREYLRMVHYKIAIFVGQHSPAQYRRLYKDHGITLSLSGLLEILRCFCSIYVHVFYVKNNQIQKNCIYLRLPSPVLSLSIDMCVDRQINKSRHIDAYNFLVS